MKKSLIKLLHILTLFLLTINYILLANAVPLTQLWCAFERNSLCNWDPLNTTYTTHKWQWITNTLRTVNFTGALEGVGDSGYFVQIFTPTEEFGADASAALLSPKIDAITTSICFQYYYYIHGVGANRIELHLLNGSDTLVWQRKYPAGDMWLQNFIQIAPQNTGFNLKFLVYSGSGAVAFDRFEANAGSCPANQVCDLESGACDWTPSGNNAEYMFNRVQGYRAVQSVEDHTTDTIYGYIFEAANGKVNDWSALTSQEYSASFGTQCLHFWYWNRLNTYNRIDVFLVDNNNTKLNVWTSNMTFPSSEWHRASVSLTFTKQQRIIIQATRLVEAVSLVDIDDIGLKPFACPEPISCDFNQDLCGYRRDISKNFIWDIGFGRVENGSALTFIYPPRDRNSPMRGMFMYSDFSRLRNTQEMLLFSEYVAPTPASCLSFYYIAMSFNDTKNVFTIRTQDTNGTLLKTVYKYSSQSDPNSNQTAKVWIQNKIVFSSSVAFRLVFSVQASEASTYVAIDDIVYKPDTCVDKTITTTSTTTLAPIIDLSCNFDANTFCNWNNTPLISKKWQLNNVNQEMISLMPNADHTKKNSQGQYAYLIHQYLSEGSSSQAAVLSIVDNSETNYKGFVCVSFWYYMRTNSRAELNVSLASPSGAVSLVVRRQNDHGERWNFANADSYEESNGYKIAFSASVSFGLVGIDDIDVSHNQCGPPKRDEPFECTFEDEHNCNFTPLYFGTLATWKLYTANETFIKAFDHTLKTPSGHFYALDYSAESGSAGVTYTYQVISQPFSASSGSCVTFWYYMRGLVKGENLTVSVKRENTALAEQVWIVSGEQGPIWHSHRLTVSSALQWQIIVGATAQTTVDGLIAIDDITVEIDKPCPTGGRCDFESGDTCLWESILPTASGITRQQRLRWSNTSLGADAQNNTLLNTDFTWTVHSPQHGSITAYPPVDHTLNSPAGYYLLLRNGGQSVGTVGSPESIIAVDDISLERGDCFVPSNMFNCSATEWVPQSKVCDYNRDCSNGADEYRCGSCDFERDECGYGHTLSGNASDVREYQWRFGDLTDGPKAGANGSSGYLIARRLATNTAHGWAELYSPMIASARRGCNLRFVYNLFDSGVTYLGESASRLSVSTREYGQNGGAKTELWRSDSVAVTVQRAWLEGYAYLDRAEHNFSIVFEAEDNSGTADSYAAIDNIRLVDCQP